MSADNEEWRKCVDDWMTEMKVKHRDIEMRLGSVEYELFGPVDDEPDPLAIWSGLSYEQKRAVFEFELEMYTKHLQIVTHENAIDYLYGISN